MADQLETLFRELAEAPEPTGLRAATDVRRRGDHRRRSTMAGAVVAVAVLAVGAVAAADLVRSGGSDDRQPPATSPDPTVTSLAADPVLRPTDIPGVGPYETFSDAGEANSTEPDSLPLTCFGDSVRNAGLPEPFIAAQSEGYRSDLDASFTETVALFPNDDAAALAVSTTLHGCRPDPTDPRFAIQTTPLAGVEASSVGVVTLPPDDAGIGYQEDVVAREGSIVVVLSWNSLGLPHGEKATRGTTRWQPVWTPQLVQLALARATGRG